MDNKSTGGLSVFTVKRANELRLARRALIGFTLIELLIVIAIIGILASVVLVSLANTRKNAKAAKALAAMQSASKVADACIINGGTLVVPSYNGTGGTVVCSTGTETLIDISDTGFAYCGTGCGGWTSVANSFYSFAIYNSTDRRLVVCANNYNAAGWFSGITGGNYAPFNFSGKSGCAKYGF